MRRSIEHRKHLESLFQNGPYPGGIICKLTNPIDGRFFEVVKKWRSDEGTFYLMRIDGVDQPKRFIKSFFARKAIVNAIMSQRAQCLKDIAAVRDELNQSQQKVA